MQFNKCTSTELHLFKFIHELELVLVNCDVHLWDYFKAGSN